jgi:nucleotide-binding universal stress UspA family protein
VIVGTAQETGLTRALLDCSTERLLHGATAPVTVVPPRWRQSAPDRISRIGVAYIDTREAREALRMAVQVALRIPARLTLYTVLGQSSERYSYLVARTDEQAFWDMVRDSFRTALDLAAAGVPPELEPRTVLLKGAVVESLAALGPNDVDVLVCGSRGYGPVCRVLLGGVSSPLIRRARLPVTVVPRATTAFAEQLPVRPTWVKVGGEGRWLGRHHYHRPLFRRQRSCQVRARRRRQGIRPEVHGGGSSDTHPHRRPHRHDRRRSRRGRLLQRRRHIAWHYLGRSPAFAMCPMCAPRVRLRRIRCCHIHMSHAMLALGQIEAMPSQREGQGFESP